MSTNVKDILFDFCGSSPPEQYINSLDIALSGYKGSIYSLVNHCIQNYQCCVPIWKCLLKYLPSAEVNGLCNLLCQYYASRRDTYKEEFPMEDIFDLFIKKGAYINFIFYDQTYLSYLVKTNNVSLVKKCVEQYGANPHLSHLLIHACNFLTECQYIFVKQMKHRLISSEWIRKDVIDMTTPYVNHDVYSYLLQLHLNVNERDKHGMTPIISACSEGSVSKIKLLLAHHPNLSFRTENTRDLFSGEEYKGVDCWEWAKRNSIYPILEQYKVQLRQTYLDVITHGTEHGTESIMNGVHDIDDFMTYLI